MRKIKLPKISLDQQPSAREKFFFLVAMAGMLFLFINVLWEPLSKKMHQEQTDLSNVELEVDGLRRLIESTKTQLRIQQSVPTREVQVDDKVKKMLDRKVVDPLSEVHSTVAMISSKRFSKKVKIDDVNIGAMVEKENYWMVPISLQITARYGGMRSFFSSIEGMDRPVVISRFDIREGSDESLINGSVDVVLYIVKR